jgi:transposase
MLHVGLDLSRRRLDVCVLSDDGELVEELAAPPDAEGLRYLVGKLARHRQPVRAVIESMTGARFVHDTLEQLGWDVLIADAQRVKGLAPLACKTDRVDSRVLAVLSHRNLVPAIWLRTRGSDGSASRRGFGCIWSSTSRCSSTGFTRR